MSQAQFIRKLRINLEYLHQQYTDARCGGETERCLDALERAIQDTRKQIEDLEADIADKAASIKYGF